MTKVDRYRRELADIPDWLPYLTENSNLPGPRGILELVAACGEEATEERAEGLVATGDEFATVCGLVALGRLFGEGGERHLPVLHSHASDDRWRVREGVAMALQRAADDDPARAFAVCEVWAGDSDPLVRRAAVAAVCEPRLLRDTSYARRALAILTKVTGDLADSPPEGRRNPEVRTLRQALGYAWSVAVAALPEEGLPAFQSLESSTDADVAWVCRENRKKARLKRLIGPSV
jgi:hypothetical protein